MILPQILDMDQIWKNKIKQNSVFQFSAQDNPLLHVTIITISSEKNVIKLKRSFSPGTLVSSTNKTDHHDITEILLNVALNTINQTKPKIKTKKNPNRTYFFWIPERTTSILTKLVDRLRVSYKSCILYRKEN